MISILLLLSLIATGAIYTMLNPIFIPADIMNAVNEVFASAWLLDGTIPVQAIFNCLFWIICLLLAKLVFKLIMGFIAMFSGGSQPNID